ncbi:cell division protein ZapB [Ferrimonas lipolytica]|uniref:Cell division protein ZapB n=1 Tax=Ferrimonas lipolytica TaxID=2724191 RepID=A0A6H1UIP5_9GAMM|nr:cell division protein ZapB [Ferrimonas lipolytica]QIZ78086.1 cell division protein ZapB [Ferrimonas lipolytica]
MSLELLEKLESRVNNALETLEITQLELEEEKLRGVELEQQRDNLQSENQRLKNELAEWHQKVEGLLGKLTVDVA